MLYVEKSVFERLRVLVILLVVRMLEAKHIQVGTAAGTVRKDCCEPKYEETTMG